MPHKPKISPLAQRNEKTWINTHTAPEMPLVEIFPQAEEILNTHTAPEMPPFWSLPGNEAAWLNLLVWAWEHENDPYQRNYETKSDPFELANFPTAPPF